MKMNGSDLIMNCLLEQDVDTVFGFPGGAVLNIYDALYKYSDKIRHVLTCHEQGAAHAADGYARSTGKTGVVIATSGPGATNLVTGIATAYMDSVPMVAITGNVASPLLGRDSFQEVDISGITTPITKHSSIVKRPEDLCPTLRRAFAIAREGRPGPVLVDIAKDVTAAICDYEFKKPETVPVMQPADNEITAAAELIEQSERPFIFAGGGVISADASRELYEFAEKISAPVALSLMGIGAYPPDGKRFTGMLGMHGTRTSALALSECDLFIAVGSRFSDRVAGSPERFAPQAKVLHIDIDAAEIGKNVRAEKAVVADAKAALSRLTGALGKKNRLAWEDRVAGWKAQFPAVIAQPGGGIQPAELFAALHDVTGGDAILTTEVGQHQMWTAQYYSFEKPRTFLSSGGLGTMGYGLGAAIGAQVAHPDKRVVNIAGDGSFYMNMNELVTAVTYNLPIVELVVNNGVLGMVRQWQKLFYGHRFSHTTLDRVSSLEKLAHAFGAEGVTVSDPAELRPALEKAFSYGRPCLVDCRIGADTNVLPMVPAGKPNHEQITELD